MGNIRLVMSIAQRYENMGAEMADLVQVIICFSHDFKYKISVNP